jgi:glucose-1-phosphate thymidylyltransferase
MNKEIVGLILGGGRGTRLSPLTNRTSKHLLPIGGMSMIARVMRQLTNAGVLDQLLLIDERFASDFMDTIRDGSQLGLRSLSYIWQPPEGKGLPTAISKVENLVQDRKMVVACGDVLIEESILKPVSDFSSQDGGARLISTNLADTAGYSELKTDGELVLDIKPKDKTKNTPGLIDLGVYMYHSDVFEKIKRLKPSDRGETEIWDLNQVYANNRSLYHTTVDGWWSDAGGNIETYLKANERYTNK